MGERHVFSAAPPGLWCWLNPTVHAMGYSLMSLLGLWSFFERVGVPYFGPASVWITVVVSSTPSSVRNVIDPSSLSTAEPSVTFP